MQKTSDPPSFGRRLGNCFLPLVKCREMRVRSGVLPIPLQKVRVNGYNVSFISPEPRRRRKEEEQEEKRKRVWFTAEAWNWELQLPHVPFSPLLHMFTNSHKSEERVHYMNGHQSS